MIEITAVTPGNNYFRCYGITRVIYECNHRFLISNTKLVSKMNYAFWNQLYFVLLMKSHLESYPCPLIINSFWNVGFLLGITLGVTVREISKNTVTPRKSNS